ncbi:MAG TPA: A24 family peptidase [Tepidisphaeraceae bacterium]|nr:A24 family peptidase [Tepidisphaeraceae bacterium]
MEQQTLIAAAPLGAALVWAALQDLHSRRIPNILTFALILCGIAQSFLTFGTVSPVQSLLGLATGFALTVALFAIGALGGGDVKLLAGVGAWLGPTLTLLIFSAAAIVGMLIVLTQALAQGRLTTLFRNTAVVGVNLMHLRAVGVEHASATGRGCRSVDRPLPYAVPVLVAAVLLACWTYSES